MMLGIYLDLVDNLSTNKIAEEFDSHYYNDDRKKNSFASLSSNKQVLLLFCGLIHNMNGVH
jgi:hypothetical protein